MADTLKQVEMNRRRMIENNEGASESSRAALSAISGRNVLKTKAETAKMRRDEEIAAQQNAAAIAKGSAIGAVTLEKAKATAAMQMDHTKRNEVLSMLNMGIYDRSFSGILGMPESVVKTAADNKAAEIQKKKAAKAAAEQAQREYEQALKDLKTAQNEKNRATFELVNAEEKARVESSLNAFNDSQKVVDDATAAREQVLKEANVDEVFVPWAKDYGLSEALAPLKNPTAYPIKALKTESIKAPTAQDLQEEKHRQETESALRIKKLKAAADYYDRLLAQKVRAKEEAGEKLSALEAKYKESIGGTLSIARAAVDEAEDKATAYQEYAQRLNDAYGTVSLSATAALQDADNKANVAEGMDEESRKNLDDQKSRLEQVKQAVERELKTEDLTVEYQDILQKYSEDLDTMIEGIETAIAYADSYEDNKEDLIYQKLDREYGTLSVSEIEERIRELEKGKVSAAADRRGASARLIEEQNAGIDASTKELRDYLEKRKEQEKQQELSDRGGAYLSEAPAGHLTERFRYVKETAQGQRNATHREYGDIAFNTDTNTEEGQDYLREEAEFYGEVLGSYEEFLRDTSAYYHNNIIPYNEGLFTAEELELYSAAERDAFDKVEFNNIGGELFHYQNGSEAFRGNYGDFYTDIPEFVAGNYGNFTAEEGKRVLALMNRYGSDAAFDYYAAIRERVAVRRAEKLNGIVRTVAGMTSGLTRFLTQGDEMIANALNGDYARIGGDIMSASHQVTMQKLEDMGIAGEGLELLYMGGYSIIDMVPTVALSMIPYVGQYAGPSYLFSKVMATNYNDSITQGKRADEAMTFAVLSAASEVSMEKILGGIPQLASKSGLSSRLTGAIEKLSGTDGMKKMLKLASSMGSEGFEEFLQEAVSPFLQKVAADLNGMTDAEIEDIDWEEAVKSFAIGAMVGGAFSASSALSSVRNSGIDQAEAYTMLENGEVEDLIIGAARLGSIRAEQIVQARRDGTPLYEGQSGWFAYASPADIVNIKKSYKRRAVKDSLKTIDLMLEKSGETDKKFTRRVHRLFEKILHGRTLTTAEAAELINNPQTAELLEAMLGMDITLMKPGEVAALARLGAFMENGKISKERIALFKKEFGEIDYAALEEIVKFSDMAEQKVSGILYEDTAGETALSESERESADVLKILSEETGVVFYVTEQYETGAYLANNMMAVNRSDIGQGVFYSIGHRVYYMAKQLLAGRGIDLKKVILEEIERSKGAGALDAEIRRIGRELAVDGNDVSKTATENELCARMMAMILEQDSGLERLAEADIEIAEVLRRSLKAVQDHLARTEVDNAKNLDNMSIKDDLKANETLLRSMDVVANIQEQKQFKNKQDVASWVLNLFDTISYTVYREGLGEIVLDKKRVNNGLRYLKTNEERWAFAAIPTVLKNGAEISRHINHKNRSYETVTIAAPIHLNGKRGNLAVVVRVDDKNYYKVHRILFVNDASNRSNKKRNIAERAGGVNKNSGLSPADNVSMNSISNSPQNVNGIFSHTFFEEVSAETSGVYNHLTQLIKKNRAEALGYRNGDQGGPSADFDPNADFDGYQFSYTDPEEVKAENGGADFVKEFDKMSQEEKERYISDRKGDLDSYMKTVLQANEVVHADYKMPENMISTSTRENKQTAGQKVAGSWHWFQRKMVDAGDAVMDIGRRTQDKSLYHFYNMARASSNAAIRMITENQTNIMGQTVGKGLNAIFQPIMKKGENYYLNFQQYLFHMHNIDRMSRYSEEAVAAADEAFQIVKEMYPELAKYSDHEIREIAEDEDNPMRFMAAEYTEALRNKEFYRNIKDKPVFDYRVDAIKSRAEAENLLRKYPEFKKLAEEVWQYSRNLMQYRVDSGLVSPEFAAKLQEIYPHYVPTGRYTEGSGQKRRVQNRVQVGKTVGRAEGGVNDLIPLHKQLADQTFSVVREGSKNRFGVRLLQNAREDPNKMPQVIKVEKTSDKLSGFVSFEGQIDEVDPFKQDEFENVFTIYENGEQYILEITPDLYEAVKALSPDKEVTEWLTKAGRKTVDLYKKMITGYNPAFAIRNIARDLQDAFIYSKDLIGFLRAYPTALRQIKNNGELWQQYKALGGTYSSVFDYNTGTVTEKGVVHRYTLGLIETLNMAVEQAPRFAEFISTVKKGDGSLENLMEAMYNAADITTNFGRSGTTGGFLNRNFVPFFNPAIQGFSKVVRTVTETKGVRPWIALIIKSAVLGWGAPALLNALLWDDEEDWEIINQRDKDTNYLFKLWNGTWLKIPRGRLLSVIGIAGDRIQQLIGGEELGWAEILSTVSTAAQQIAPTNPLTSNIFSPLVNVAMNKTWYGGDIESDRLQDYAPEERYDAKTDAFSKWLGSVIKASPKKINYILDSYTGVLGDALLPAMSVAAEENFFTKAFVIDANYSNRLSGDFYDRLDRLTWNKNGKDAEMADHVLYRFWNARAGELSEINKEIRAIEEDASLTKEDKEALLGLAYESRNSLILQAEEDYEQYFQKAEELTKDTAGYSDEAADYYYRETNKAVFGVEYALKAHSKATYDRAVKARDEQGIGFEVFYDVYFDDSADTEKSLALIEAGFEKESALAIGRKFEALEPEEGAEGVSTLQKYRAIDDAEVSEYEKLWAMSVLATDTDKRRVAVSTEYDVSLKAFIDVKENVSLLDESVTGTKGVSNAKVTAAINQTEGLNVRQKAALWQIFTGSNSAKNNPYSVSVGWEAIAKNKAYKEVFGE
ncbi:MAG: hypothetical protein IJ043_06280 [Clostridia bacterium]|nr:hypothetical protein [Clostridia bacterium]